MANYGRMYNRRTVYNSADCTNFWPVEALIPETTRKDREG